MKENQIESKEIIHPTHSKKLIFSQDLRDSKASQSFAVEQISETTNRLASRKLMFSQKTSGVIVTQRLFLRILLYVSLSFFLSS